MAANTGQIAAAHLRLEVGHLVGELFDPVTLADPVQLALGQQLLVLGGGGVTSDALGDVTEIGVTSEGRSDDRDIVLLCDKRFLCLTLPDSTH